VSDPSHQRVLYGHASRTGECQRNRHPLVVCPSPARMDPVAAALELDKEALEQGRYSETLKPIT